MECRTNRNFSLAPLRESFIPYPLTLVLLLLATLLSGGCATSDKHAETQTKSNDLVYSETYETPSVKSYDDYYDPLEPFNRAMFTLNDYTFRYALSPLAEGYQMITPDPVEQGIRNAFNNGNYSPQRHHRTKSGSAPLNSNVMA